MTTVDRPSGTILFGVISVGHLGSYELSAANLATSAMNITGFAVLVRAHRRSSMPLLVIWNPARYNPLAHATRYLACPS